MAEKPKSSFIPSSRVRCPNIPGTAPSLHDNLLVVSTGVPSVDSVLGCLPIGTVLLVEEDKYRTYSKVFTKYYVAEGVINGHDIICASADGSIDNFCKDLPSPVESKKDKSNISEEELKIAWRYQSQSSKQPAKSSTFNIGHNFDLTKPLPEEKKQKVNIKTIDINELNNNSSSKEGSQDRFSSLISAIQSHIDDEGLHSSPEIEPKNILRILITGLGSPMWNSSNPHQSEIDTLRFMYRLRAVLRRSVATCVITAPAFLWENHSFQPRLRHLSDTVIRLESFAASDKETNPVYKDYHGLFHIEKIPRLNSLLPHTTLVKDLAFKLGKRKFVVEKMYLPPVFDDDDKQPQSFCASKSGKSMDF